MSHVEPQPFGWQCLETEPGSGVFTLISSSRFYISGFPSQLDAYQWLLAYLDHHARRESETARHRLESEERLKVLREEMMIRLMEPPAGAKAN